MTWRSVLIVLLGIFFTLLFLKVAPLPYLWIGLMWLAFISLGAIHAENQTLRAVYFNAGVGIAFFLCLEIYALTNQEPAETASRTYTAGYQTAHPHLGYAPNKGITIDSSLVVNGETIYDVTYTINATGQRIGSRAPVPGKDCILFLGDSYTFGEGLQDDETLPWRVGELTGIPTINFGFHGYGPHQALAAIQNGIVEDVATCKPVAAILSTMSYHVFRSAGNAPWDADGPRYIVGPDSKALHTGTFKDSISTFDTLLRKAKGQLESSFAYRRFIGNYAFYKDEDIAIYLAVIAAAQRELQAIYPGIEFSVLYWDDRHGDDINARLQADIAAIPARLYSVTAGIPDIIENRGKYVLAHDGHPSAAANEKLAHFVVQEILAVQPGSSNLRQVSVDAAVLQRETADQSLH